MGDGDWSDDEPDPAAIKAQQELLARRDKLMQARERLHDPWDTSTDDDKPAQPLDADKVLTGLADVGHDLGDGLQHLGQQMSEVPIVGAPLSTAAATAGAAAHATANLRDRDHDGLTDGQEQARHTNPVNPDTDSDGLPDGVEVNVFHSNPNRQDTDGDGISDFDEASRAGITYGRDGTARYQPTSRVTTPASPPTSARPPHDGPITSPSQVEDAGPPNRPVDSSGDVGIPQDATVASLVDSANPNEWSPGDAMDMQGSAQQGDAADADAVSSRLAIGLDGDGDAGSVSEPTGMFAFDDLGTAPTSDAELVDDTSAVEFTSEMTLPNDTAIDDVAVDPSLADMGTTDFASSNDSIEEA